MGFEITCDRCRNILEVPGALAFGPPRANATCVKLHMCVKCWNEFNKWACPTAVVGALVSTIRAAADPKSLVRVRPEVLARRKAEIEREALVVRDENGSFTGYGNLPRRIGPDGKPIPFFNPSNRANPDNDLTEANLKKALKQIRKMVENPKAVMRKNNSAGGA